MINRIRRIARRALPCLLIGLTSVASAALGDLGPTLPARAQIGGIGTPNTFTSVVFTNSIAAQTTNTLASQPYTVVPNYDLGLEIFYLTTGVSGQGSNILTTVNGTVDGTNWMSKPLFTLLSKSDGTNGVRFYTNFPASTISSLYQVRIDQIGNSDTNLLTNSYARFVRAKKPVQPPGLQ